MLRPGDDFAMAFCVDGKYVWWIGRCNQLFQKRGRKKWELREVSEPVESNAASPSPADLGACLGGERAFDSRSACLP